MTKTTNKERILRVLDKVNGKNISLKALAYRARVKNEKVLRDHLWCMDKRDHVINHVVVNNTVLAYVI